MRRRLAYTLVELTVTMTAGSSLMILAIGMLHQSMTLASTAQATSDHQRTLHRLAQEFRGDVHRAAECFVTSEEAVRLVMSSGAEISYAISDKGVTRHQQLDDGLARHESFECGAGVTATFQSLAQPDRAVLTVVTQPHRSINQRRVDRRIAAVVGRLIAHQNAEVSP